MRFATYIHALPVPQTKLDEKYADLDLKYSAGNGFMKIVRTTLSRQKDAKALSVALVSSGFAKCVSWRTVKSEHVWKGARKREAEFELEAKCASKECAAKAAKLVCDMHPYAVPMIIILDVEWANAPYLKWLKGKE